MENKRLPKIYSPLTELDGYYMWSLDEKYHIYYFNYKINLGDNVLRIYVYFFCDEAFTGIEYILDKSNDYEEKAKRIVDDYRKEARKVLEKRERIRNLFK